MTTPTDPRLRVYRGGAWNGTTATSVRAAYRNDSTPTNRGSVVGVRTAQCGCRQPLKG